MGRPATPGRFERATVHGTKVVGGQTISFDGEKIVLAK
jgi:hypothetical protein